jgi:uncharacterized protein YbaR (Trm112 family)
MTFNFQQARQFLACPKSRTELVLDKNTLVSTCPNTRLAYPIVDEIPRLLVEEAQQLTTENWQQIMQSAHRSPQTGLPL